MTREQEKERNEIKLINVTLIITTRESDWDNRGWEKRGLHPFALSLSVREDEKYCTTTDAGTEAYWHNDIARKIKNS